MISFMLQVGCTKKEICIATGKGKSVISRELKRNSHKCGYSAKLAQEYADERKECYRLRLRFTDSISKKVVWELRQGRQRRYPDRNRKKTGFLFMKKLKRGKNAKNLAR